MRLRSGLGELQDRIIVVVTDTLVKVSARKGHEINNFVLYYTTAAKVFKKWFCFVEKSKQHKVLNGYVGYLHSD